MTYYLSFFGIDAIMVIIWFTVLCRKLDDEETDDEETENNEEHDIHGHNNLGLRNPQSLV